MQTANLCLLILCSIWTNNSKKPITYEYKIVNADTSYIIQKTLNPEKLIIPMLWFEINKSSVDSAIEVAIKYEKIDSENSSPILHITDTSFMAYLNRQIVHYGNCEFEVYRFEASPDNWRNSEDFYWVYYIKELGFITTQHNLYDEAPFTRFDLAKVYSSDSTNLIDIKILQKIITQLNGN